MRLKTPESHLDQAEQEGIPPEKLQHLRGLVLGEAVKTFPLSLIGDPPTKTTQKTDPDKVPHGMT